MKIIHLYMSKLGIRFFKNIKYFMKQKFDDKIYYNCFREKEFINKLSITKDDYDMVLITTHGSEDAIVIPHKAKDRINFNSNFKRYIKLDKTKHFKNNFVFAIACNTAVEFGPKSIDNGCLAYLGYETQIKNIFYINDLNMCKKVRKTYEEIIKKIFVEELVNSIYKFITDFQNVKMLKQWFSFHLEKRLINFFNMSVEEIYENYNYKVDKNIWKKNKPKLTVMQLNFLKESNNHLICCGDPNYISMIGFEMDIQLDEKTLERIEKIGFIDKNYEKIFKDNLNKNYGENFIEI